TNAAANATGPVAPGELVTIYGSGMDAVKDVQFNGVPAPVLYTTMNQTGAMVPYGIAGANAQISVQAPAAISTPFTIPIAPVAPGVFTSDGSGRGQASALNQNGVPNGSGNPATAGQTLTIFATGGGQITGTPPHPVATVTVTIGGIAAEVQSVSESTGVIQVRVLVPDRVFGVVPIVVSAGGVTSQAGVTIVVR